MKKITALLLIVLLVFIYELYPKRVSAVSVTIISQFNSSAAGGTTLAIANVAVGPNQQLIVAAMGADGANNGVTGEVTGITFGAQAMTKIVEDLNNLGDDGVVVSIWQLQNPTAGTQTVTITYNGNPTHGVSGNAYVISGAQSIADATAHNGALTASSPTTNAITTIQANDLVLDIFAASSGSETLSVGGAPQILDYNTQPGGGNFSPVGGSRYIASIGSSNFSWTPSSLIRGYTWASIALAPLSSVTIVNNGATEINNGAIQIQP